MESFADKLPILVHLEGVADGGLYGIRMEEAEAILADLIVVGVGDPAFEGVVVERHSGNEDLDL